MQQINSMMETLSNNMKNMIKDEINSTRQQSWKPQNENEHMKKKANSRNQSEDKSQTHNITPNELNPIAEEDSNRAAHTTVADLSLPTSNTTHTLDQETEKDLKENQWTLVNRRRERQPVIQHTASTDIGTSDEDLQAADKRAWLFMGRLKPGTTSDSVKKFLNKRGIKENIISEELPTNGNTKAFKVGIPFDCLERVKEPEFWPPGVNVRRFRFFRRNDGISLG